MPQDGGVTVFGAHRVISFGPRAREATHVAVRGGRILAVGTASDMKEYGSAAIDGRFAGQVLMPGLIEGHAHTTLGDSWGRGVYVGSFDRSDPGGRTHPARLSANGVVQGLEEADLPDRDGVLVAWGPDPLLFEDGSNLDAAVLDRVSTKVPIVVIHASGHIAYFNSPALARAGLRDRDDLDGVIRDSAGRPTGEVRGIEALLAGYGALELNIFELSDIEKALVTTARIANGAGVTTFGDLGAVWAGDEGRLAAAEAVTSRDDFPLRLVPAVYPGVPGRLDPEAKVAEMLPLFDRGNDKLVFGAVKMAADGSIQGFTARILPPHYHGTGANGIWNTEPAVLTEWVAAFHEAGFQIHCHCNGDEASRAFIDAVAAAQHDYPRKDHRHTIQHGQMITRGQFRQMAQLGMGANLFVNHLYYWGDAHAEVTLGPERAARMDDCAAALRYGVPLTIHSDAPITPISPLFTAWCAVNRVTSSGRVLGPSRRIGVEQALRAITIGAAYSLKVDHLVGSIEPGKYADFTVLAEDPLQADPMRLKDVPVVATVLGGRVIEATGR